MTWDGHNSGNTEVYLDGILEEVEKIHKNIGSGEMAIVIGQEQDGFASGFDDKDAFEVSPRLSSASCGCSQRRC